MYDRGLWVSPFLQGAGVTAAFTTREFAPVCTGPSSDRFVAGPSTSDVEVATGVSWQDLRSVLHLPPRVVSVQQVHGADVLRIARGAQARAVTGVAALPGVVAEQEIDRVIARCLQVGTETGRRAVAKVMAADGIVTDAPECALSLVVADCVPIVLADPHHRVVGVVHAGWRGLAEGVVEAGVGALCSLGGDVARSVALIGPAICPGCYEVGEDVRERVGSRVAEARAQTRDGHFALDVRGGVATVLRAEGITLIAMVPDCTYEDSHRYYSHRRATPDSVAPGRQAAVVSLMGSW